MSCGHGCGYRHHPSYDRDWFFRDDWQDDPRIGRRERRWSRGDDAPAVEALETRLAGLHGAIRRLEAELLELREHTESGRPAQAMTPEPSDR
jgi:hypothetical protein